jgi:DNA polymerase III delta prime subunit
MMTARTSFTPSLLDGPTLEKLFVNREPILAEAVARIENAATSGNRPHALFVGPRGSGKTHLISLIHYRATQLAGYGTRFTMAWLPEDPWDVFDYDTFTRAIANAREHADAPLTVVFAENFDYILAKLGPEGQRCLRARIENDEDLLLVVSSTRLTSDIVSQAKPFYGFFDTVYLKPFTLDEAIAMLQRSAEVDGDQALKQRLGQPDVRARLAAIDQLAGGQPRLWALLSAGLTIDTVEDLVSLLITQFDDLTPYYQEQLGKLSANELRIVLALVDADAALTPAQIAERTSLSPRTVSSTLGRLKPAWVVAHEGLLMQYVDKRLTFYQLAEPLARVGLQIKASKGKPVKLVVDFLSAWFSHSDLASRKPEDSLTDAAADLANLSMYLQAALQQTDSPESRLRESLLAQWPSPTLVEPSDDPDVVAQAARIDEALASLQHEGSALYVLALPVAFSSLIETRLTDASVGLQRVELALVALRAGGDGECLDRAIDAIAAVHPDEQRLATIGLGMCRAELGQHDAAQQVILDALARDDAPLSDAEWHLLDSLWLPSHHATPPTVRGAILAAAAPLVHDRDLPELTVFASSLLVGKTDPDSWHSPALGSVLSEVARRLGAEEPAKVTTLSDLDVALAENIPLDNADWVLVRSLLTVIHFSRSPVTYPMPSGGSRH